MNPAPPVIKTRCFVLLCLLSSGMTLDGVVVVARGLPQGEGGAGVARRSRVEQGDQSVAGRPPRRPEASGTFRDLLRCPECHAKLALSAQEAICEGCGRRAPFSGGVLKLVGKDDFYEAAYCNEVRHLPGSNALKDLAFFELVQSGVFGHVRDVAPKGGRILDVGCASGIRWFGRDFETMGVDLSFQSVRNTAAFYALSAQANASRLPLVDGSVDVVYSSYFWEHVPPDQKDHVLEELVRVLRPGGSTVLLFDTLSENAFGRFARRDPAAFHRGFVKPDGHVGLEPLSAALERHRRAGLTVDKVVKLGTTVLQYMASYTWLANAYGDSIPWVRWAGRASRSIANGSLRLPVEWFTTAFDRFVGPWASPDLATRAIVVARKAGDVGPRA